MEVAQTKLGNSKSAGQSTKVDRLSLSSNTLASMLSSTLDRSRGPLLRALGILMELREVSKSQRCRNHGAVTTHRMGSNTLWQLMTWISSKGLLSERDKTKMLDSSQLLELWLKTTLLILPSNTQEHMQLSTRAISQIGNSLDNGQFLLSTCKEISNLTKPMRKMTLTYLLPCLSLPRSIQHTHQTISGRVPTVRMGANHLWPSLCLPPKSTAK